MTTLMALVREQRESTRKTNSSASIVALCRNVNEPNSFYTKGLPFNTESTKAIGDGVRESGVLVP